MASRQSRAPQPPPPSNRQNEYFVPRDGIDREVITADVCRYLGNDALVRPGVYESPQTGAVTQGYYITAYRNLTSAMIEDLKADSSRWDQERRQQSARNPVGVQYRNSDTHQSRQYYGPTEGAASYQDPSRDQYEASPRYPGTGNAGYTGASTGFTSQSYGGNQGGYPAGYNTAQSAQFAASPEVSYPGAGSMSSGFGQPSTERPYMTMGTNYPIGNKGTDTAMYGTNDHPSYQNANARIATTTMAQGRPTYVTSGPPAQQAYPAQNQPSNFYSPTTAAPGAFAPQSDSRDPFYGRASPAGNPGYGATHEQFDTTPRAAVPSKPQPASGGTSSRHAARDSVERVERDRHAEARHRHRSGR